MGKIILLVVEPTPLKNMKINWDDEILNIWIKCFKAPTSDSWNISPMGFFMGKISVGRF